jgi:hypothetical protein
MFRVIKELLFFIFGLVEALLSLRFILKLFGASAKSDFVSWIYDTTRPLLQPFVLVFPTPSVKGPFILEFTTLFAILMFAFLGYFLLQILESLAHYRHKS